MDILCPVFNLKFDSMATINSKDETLLFVTTSKHGDMVCCQIGKDKNDFESYVVKQANEAIARQLVPQRLMCSYKLNKNPDLPNARIDDPTKAQNTVN